MTPQQLYDFIKMAYPVCEVASICCVSKDCVRGGFCPDKQTEKVINFDAVKDKFYKGQTPTPASVDAICVSTGDLHRFCFVEMKGWKLYIDNVTKQKLTPEETAAGYNLAGKLVDSQQLCIDITAEKDLFAFMPIQFILVTDIDTSLNGIEAFQSMLNLLGQTSTDLYSKCLSQANKCLESEIYIDKVYTTCKDCDKIFKL